MSTGVSTEHDGLRMEAVFVVRADGRTATVPADIWCGFCSEPGAGPCHDRLADEWWWSEPVGWQGREVKPAIERRTDGPL